MPLWENFGSGAYVSKYKFVSICVNMTSKLEKSCSSSKGKICIVSSKLEISYSSSKGKICILSSKLEISCNSSKSKICILNSNSSELTLGKDLSAVSHSVFLAKLKQTKFTLLGEATDFSIDGMESSLYYSRTQTHLVVFSCLSSG